MIDAKGMAARERAAELYALGLPVELILRETGLKRTSFDWAMRTRNVRRPSTAERRMLQRDLRMNRIKANVLETPSVSMFDWNRKAA